MQNTRLALGLGGQVQAIKFIVDYNDVATLGAVTSGQIAALEAGAAWSLPAGSKIIGVEAKNTARFTGAGPLTAATVSVGKTGSVTYFSAAYDVFAAIADTSLQETALFKSGQRTALPILFNFVLTGGNANALTAGVVEITIYYLPVSTP